MIAFFIAANHGARERAIYCDSVLNLQNSNAIGYAKFFSRSHDAVIRVCDDAGNLIKRTSTRAILKSGERFCVSNLLSPGLAAKTTCVISLSSVIPQRERRITSLFR